MKLAEELAKAVLQAFFKNGDFRDMTTGDRPLAVAAAEKVLEQKAEEEIADLNKPVGEQVFEFQPDSDVLFDSEIVAKRCENCGDPATCGERCSACCTGCANDAVDADRLYKGARK
jgi:hypothetical protein